MSDDSEIGDYVIRMKALIEPIFTSPKGSIVGTRMPKPRGPAYSRSDVQSILGVSNTMSAREQLRNPLHLHPGLATRPHQPVMNVLKSNRRRIYAGPVKSMLDSGDQGNVSDSLVRAVLAADREIEARQRMVDAIKKHDEATREATRIAQENIVMYRKYKTVMVGGRRGGGGSGLLSAFGIGGASPYARFGKGGMYGGVSGIDVLGMLRNGIGTGGGGVFSRKEMSAGKKEGAEYLMRKVGHGSGTKMAATAIGGAGVLAGAAVTGGLLLIAAVLFTIAKKITELVKNTEVFKWLKSLLQNIISAGMSILLIPLLVLNNMIGSFRPLILEMISTVTAINEPILNMISVIGVLIEGLGYIFGSDNMKKTGKETREYTDDMLARLFPISYGETGRKSMGTNIANYAAEQSSFYSGSWQAVKDVFNRVKEIDWTTLDDFFTSVYDMYTEVKDWMEDPFGTENPFRDASSYAAMMRLDFKGMAVSVGGMNLGMTALSTAWNLIKLGVEKAYDIASEVNKTWRTLATVMKNTFMTYFVDPIGMSIVRVVNTMITSFNKLPIKDIDLLVYSRDEAGASE